MYICIYNFCQYVTVCNYVKVAYILNANIIALLINHINTYTGSMSCELLY